MTTAIERSISLDADSSLALRGAYVNSRIPRRGKRSPGAPEGGNRFAQVIPVGIFSAQSRTVI
jgi:hypothetical protein